MPNLSVSDLRDPSPPMPGEAQRAAVARRAHELGRRRRVMQGAGALGMVAVVAVSVAALTAGGTSTGPARTQRVEAANASGATPATPAPAISQAAPAVTPAVDAATPDSGAPAAVGDAPSTFTVSGVVTNVPVGVTLTVTLTGSQGSFTAVADRSGAISVAGVPPGDYSVAYEWVSADGTASRVGKLVGVTVTVAGDTSVELALP